MTAGRREASPAWSTRSSAQIGVCRRGPTPRRSVSTRTRPTRSPSRLSLCGAPMHQASTTRSTLASGSIGAACWRSISAIASGTARRSPFRCGSSARGPIPPASRRSIPTACRIPTTGRTRFICAPASRSAIAASRSLITSARPILATNTSPTRSCSPGIASSAAPPGAEPPSFTLSNRRRPISFAASRRWRRS